jgi:nucleotide-binding universal stress UspA family protein
MHIFFATDGSASAGFALAHILTLSWPPPVHITVMMAVNVPQPRFTSLTPLARRAYSAALATLRQDEQTKAKAVIAEMRRALEPHVEDVATRIHEGSPSPVIVETVRACRADLLVVGSRGLGAIMGFLLGSVSKHVVRHAPCSVLLAKCPPVKPGRFLLALDGSAHARTALRWLADLHLSPEDSIHLLAVEEAPMISSTAVVVDRNGAGHTVPSGRLGAAGTAAEEFVAEAKQALGARGVRLGATIRRGHVASEILAAVREFRPDLLVLGAKGRHSPPESLLGSVARKVIYHAPCSVLIVRP